MYPRNFIAFLIALAAIIVGVVLYYSNTEQTPVVEEDFTTGQAQNETTQNDAEPVASELPNKFLIENVPFTSQAPFANWEDPRQQDGCEEASVLMAIRWVRGENLTKQQALDEILAMSEFEKQKYGEFHDSSSQDTADRLLKDYFEYENYKVEYDIDVEDIKKELAAGNLVIVPADGRKLGNPNFTGEGPERHKLVIRGYDDNKNIFITNDPGTRKGEGYQYGYEVLMNAVRDYPTGYKVPITDGRKAMIVVSKY